MPTCELGQCRILIVDDEDANVRLMTRVLQGAGYRHLRGITDPREAMPAFEQWTPDLVVLDLRMPHIDGISLLRTMRAQCSPSEFVPVLVLTADGSREALTRALSAGANDYLTKPVDVDELLLRVRNLLGIRLSHESLKNTNAALATALRRRVQVDERRAIDRRHHIAAIRAVIQRGPAMVFQPLVELATNRIVGVEALARFDSSTSPDRWFAQAASFGLGAELEIAAVSAALQHLDRLEAQQFMAVNVSPDVMFARPLQELLCTRGRGRLVVELTEHQPVENYEDLRVVCGRLRRDDIRIAIDDAGAGYASIHHILKLAPDIIKLDMTLTRDVDRDPAKRALATALVQFARESKAIVTAEGIETASELETLRDLDVSWGQGFHIGRPAPLTSGPMARIG